jgi:hypothetical protein
MFNNMQSEDDEALGAQLTVEAGNDGTTTTMAVEFLGAVQMYPT